MKRARPTLFDVAAKAGVSKSTVSRVINEHPYVGDQARRAVEAAALALGYQPNRIARSLRTNATMTVGLIVTGLRNEVFAANAQGCERVLSGARRTLVIGSSNADPEREVRVVHDFLERGVDGLIMSLADERSPLVRRELARRSVPVVLLDRDAPGVAADRVLTEHRGAVTEAVADLRRHGHEHIALLCPVDQVRPGRETQAAFVDAAGERAVVRQTPLTADAGHATTRALMRAAGRPTAMLVCGTQVLAGVLGALRELGIRIPVDLSLVAYDDSAAAGFHEPPISVISRDTELMGEAAANLVLEQISGTRTRLRKVFFDARYVPRGSVLRPAGRPRSP